MLRRIKSLFLNDEGIEIIEYALVVSVIALVALIGYIVLGQAISVKNAEVALAVSDSTVPAIP